MIKKALKNIFMKIQISFKRIKIKKFLEFKINKSKLNFQNFDQVSNSK